MASIIPYFMWADIFRKQEIDYDGLVDFVPLIYTKYILSVDLMTK